MAVNAPLGGLTRLALLAIRAYRRIWHPVLQGCADRGVVLNRCRFVPGCSEYAETALNRYPFFPALKLIIKRLWRCRGKSAGPVADPVPMKGCGDPGARC